jgi:adenylyl- and sulfurtransferase ThiI
VSTRESIDKEVASMPEELQQKVYEFAMRLKRNTRDEAFNGAELSESILALDWNSPEEDAAWSNL